MQAQRSVKQQWLAVMALAVGAFIFNTTEFIPIALLSDIGRSFSMSAAETGIMLTVYAWIVALMSLPLMLLTQKAERRKLLLVLLAVFAAAHLLSALAWNFEVLLASRVAVALVHAVFWSVTASLAIRVAPPGKGNQALGWLSTGSVLAMVAGIPLGRMIGQFYSWQTSFLMIGACAAAVMLVLAKSLPLLPSVNAGSLASLPLLAKRRNLMLLFAFTVLIVTAHFTAYSYIEPFVLEVGAFQPQQVTVLLGLYGLAGFAASYVFGRWFAKQPRLFLAGSAAVIGLAGLLLLPLAASPLALYVLCFLWGMAVMVVSLSMVSKVLAFADDAADAANAIYSGLYNVGIGGGAFLGRYISESWGLERLGISTFALAAVALCLALVLVKRADFTSKPMA